MFLLQILNETDTESVSAIVVVHARFARVEVVAAREVATALSGRPIVAAALHAAHSRAVARTRGRQEDCTCGFEF